MQPPGAAATVAVRGARGAPPIHRASPAEKPSRRRRSTHPRRQTSYYVYDQAYRPPCPCSTVLDRSRYIVIYRENSMHWRKWQPPKWLGTITTWRDISGPVDLISPRVVAQHWER